MERTLSLALISLCTALCLGQGSVPRCDMELYEDEEFVSRRYDQNNHSPSARHCQLMCTQNPDCHFFSFHTPSRPSGKYVCTLGERIRTLKRAKMAGVISGYSLRGCPQSKNPCFDEVYDEVAFINDPYSRVQNTYSTLRTNNHKECRERCREDQSCYFYTYYKSRSECELKFSMPIPSPIWIEKSNVFSGFSDIMKTDFGSGEVCPAELHVDVQLDQGSYGILHFAISAEHCQALCNIHPQCQVFMFMKKTQRQNCFMKSSSNSETIPIKKPGVTSGRAQKGCKVDFSWKQVTFKGPFYGRTLSKVSQPDLKSCQESCNKNPNCLFYTFYTKDYYYFHHRMKCFLRGALTLPMPYAVSKRDAISGFGMKCSVWKCE